MSGTNGLPDPADPVALTQALVRIPSVTPDRGEAVGLCAELLARAGFACHRADRGGVANLVAVAGDPASGPVLGFNGHVDVVPPGDPAAWGFDPFSATIADGRLWGRGAADMKSGVAAFLSAACGAVAAGLPRGAVVVTITGDEEGEAEHGTRAILDWMARQGLGMDFCLVGEPTCPERMGEMIKIGRRGSLTAHFTARGVQGHAAYPHRARNPLPALVRLLDRLASRELDRGSRHFDPSTLAITTIDTGNPASNVIPAEARATVNIRFNDLHDGASLAAWLREEALQAGAPFGVSIDCETRISGEAFLTEPGPFVELVARAVEEVTGVRPELSTSGGTSDARFIRALCPVVEFGLVGRTMHQVDENVEIEHIRALAAVYRRIIDACLAPGA